MKSLSQGYLLAHTVGGNGTISRICAGLAVARAGAWLLTIAVLGSAGVWLGIGAACAVNAMLPDF